MDVVGQTNTAQGAAELAANLDPDVVLMDTDLRDGTGLEALKVIKAQQLKCKVVILSDHEVNDSLYEAFRSGANGYISKDTPVESLLAALRALGRGEQILSRQLTRQIVEEFSRLGNDGNAGVLSLDGLTSREREVLRHVGTGARNREIAERLTISEHTVKVHVRNILEKLRVKNRSQLVSVSLRNAVGPSVRRSIFGVLAIMFVLDLVSLVNFNGLDSLFN